MIWHQNCASFCILISETKIRMHHFLKFSLNRFSLLCCLLAICWASPATAQEASNPCSDQHCWMVLAPSGLNLRSAPRLKAKKIGKLPYLAEAETLDAEPVPTGKIGDREGAWVKVRYQDLEGWAFDNYLSQYFYPLERTTPGDFLYTYENCRNNYHLHDDLNYYGLFKNEETYTLRKVSFNYYFFHQSEVGGEFMGMEFKKGVRPEWVMGLEKEIPEKEVPTLKAAGQGDPLLIYNPVLEEMESQLLEYGDYSIQVSLKDKEAQPYHAEINSIRLTGMEGQEQDLYLSLQNLLGEIYDINFPTVDWVGDADGDGKMDMVLSMGEETSIAVLFLSSMASEGEILKAIGAWHSGYCC